MDARDGFGRWQANGGDMAQDRGGYSAGGVDWLEVHQELSTMPLYSGKKNVGRNIKTLQKEKKPHKQAIAIALRIAGLAKKK